MARARNLAQPGRWRRATASRRLSACTRWTHGQRLYTYEVTSDDLPITDFRGEFRIREDGPKKCTVVWTAQFAVSSGDEKAVSDAVREFFRAGVRSIEARHASRP